MTDTPITPETTAVTAATTPEATSFATFDDLLRHYQQDMDRDDAQSD